MAEKRKIFFKIMKQLLAVILVISLFSHRVYAECYTKYYRKVGCSLCSGSDFDTSQRDSCKQKHERQYSIKLCSKHKNQESKSAEYYKRGYIDYNCLAYALGCNYPCSWEWEYEWGEIGPTIEEFIYYIIKKGYSYANQASIAYGKKIIYVYAKDGHVKHFARKYTLDGKELSGYATISKWGRAALYKTKSIDPYETSSIYGKMVLVCYK